MSKKVLGIIGLGVMGKSLALNAISHKIPLSVYNRLTEEEKDVVPNFMAENTTEDVLGFTDIEEFVASLESPRKILIMVKAGAAVDAVIASIQPFLSSDDILIDGGNSHYKETIKRTEILKTKGIHLIGLGVSGGEEGARKGPCMMPGGSEKSYLEIANVLERISAKDEEGKPCCSYIGDNGAGHFVKMVHNGIEYGDMQLIAESFDVLSKTKDYEYISKLFFTWNSGELSSYLLEISAKILEVKEGEEYLLDKILDKAGNKGTGAWSSTAALELGVPTTVKTAAVFARYISSYKAIRVKLSNEKENTKKEYSTVDEELLKQVYDFTRTINLHQGLQLINEASKEYSWKLNLSEVCRIWTNGCIIKSEKIKEYSKRLQKIDILLDDREIVEQLREQEEAVQAIISYAVSNRISIPCIMAAYNYWISITNKNSSANLIQAQRDYFGAHTFNRIDNEESVFFHHNW